MLINLSKVEFEDYLIANYPILFSELNNYSSNVLSPLGCYGVQCGSIWWKVVDSVSKELEVLNSADQKVTAIQVGESLEDLVFRLSTYTSCTKNIFKKFGLRT